MIKDNLLHKIRTHDAKVAVVGLGYVGLPLVLRFGEEHFKVLGFDTDAEKVKKLSLGKSYIRHIEESRLQTLQANNLFEATTDFQRLAEADCIIICVPTPLSSSKDPDLQYIENTADAIKQTLRKGQIISLESTTYPGTTEEILLSKLQATGLAVGEDYFVVYSPEREDPGNVTFSTRTIPKIVGGITSSCLEIGRELYAQVIDTVITVSSTKTAELVKLLENIYRSVNIALVNELKLLCHRMDIDIWEVIEAAGTKPFGYTPFYPGPGLGGHCIPIDPFYLSWKAKEYDFATRFIQLAGEINTSMPYYVIERLAAALNEKSKAIKGSKVLIMGVAYKKDVDDVRESPAFEIMEFLEHKGAVVSYSDPYVPRLTNSRRHNFGHMSSVSLTEGIVRSQDAVLIATDHTDIDYQWVVDNANLVLDTRNATRRVMRAREKIFHA